MEQIEFIARQVTRIGQYLISIESLAKKEIENKNFEKIKKNIIIYITQSMPGINKQLDKIMEITKGDVTMLQKLNKIEEEIENINTQVTSYLESNNEYDISELSNFGQNYINYAKKLL